VDVHSKVWHVKVGSCNFSHPIAKPLVDAKKSYVHMNKIQRLKLTVKWTHLKLMVQMTLSRYTFPNTKVRHVWKECESPKCCLNCFFGF